MRFRHFIAITLLCLLTFFLFFFDGFFVFKDRPSANVLTSGCVKKGTLGAYIINLDRSPHRLRSALPMLAGLSFPVHRISAIDGKMMTDEALGLSVDLMAFQKVMGRLPGKGEIACALSHIKAWQSFLMSSYEYAIIFEDDIHFDAHLLEKTVYQLIEQKSSWDVCNLDIREKGERMWIYRKMASLENRELRMYYQGVYCGDAYIMNRRAAHRLISKALPLKMTIEDYFARGWEFGLFYTALYPRLVYQQDTPSVLASQPCLRPRPHGIISPTLARLSGRIYRMKTGLVRMVYVFLSQFSILKRDHYDA